MIIKRSDLCDKSVEEAAFEYLSSTEGITRVRIRQMMIGEFGKDDTLKAIDEAEDIRELMGLKRQYAKRSLVREMVENNRRLNDACTN